MPIKPEVQAIIDRLREVDWKHPKHDIETIKLAYKERYESRPYWRPLKWIEDPREFDPWVYRGSRTIPVLGTLRALFRGGGRYLGLDRLNALHLALHSKSTFKKEWRAHVGWAAIAAGYSGVPGSRRVGTAKQTTSVEHPAWEAWAAASCMNFDSGAGRKYPKQKLQDIVDTCLPMLTAYEAGAYAHLFLDNEIRILAAPATHVDDQNRIHREDGPALEWPHSKIYAWHGLKVPKSVATQPEKITVGAINAQKNIEVRRVMIERFGYERYISDMPVIHEDATGKLRRCFDSKGQRAGVVEVVNGTKEPDGTRNTYFLSVPPECRTAIEAVAWTYGLTAEEYATLQVRT